MSIVITKITQSKQRGAAAIFIVLFFTLLIGVITLSFVTIVNQDQQQSIDNDLSQSAYDSAEAGVEDGKRALDVYRKCSDQACKDTFENDSFVNPNTPGNSCYSIYNIRDKIGVDTGPKPEINVSRKGNANDKKLNQAYSCVSIATQTPDFLYTQAANKVDLLIPLRSLPGKSANSFDISWFDKGRDTDDSISSVTFHGYPDLPKTAAQWGPRTPSLLRIQLIKVAKKDIKLEDVDNDSRAAFLYPSSGGAAIVNLSDIDPGRNSPKDATNTPQQVACTQKTAYACTVSVTADGLDTSGPDDYYLRIIPVYNKTSYRVQMKNVSDVVYFDNVQPEIDSTGRANDVFRRTLTRVTYNDEIVNTVGGFDSTQGICKAYSVAVLPEDYDNSGVSCDP